MRTFLLVFTLFLSSYSFGQTKCALRFTNTNYQQIKRNIPSHFSDSITAKKYLAKLQFSAIQKGYLLASIDTLLYKPNEWTASFFLGPKFGKAKLIVDNEDLEFFKKYMHINERFFRDIPFSPHQLASILRNMQGALENNGYPFGKVFLREISIENENLEARIIVKKNKLMQWKEIHIKGDSSISKAFLSNIIRIKEGDKYNQEELRYVSKRIKQINFLKEIRPHEILFTPEGAELYVYISSNPISSVNGVAGLQQNSKTNKTTITGDISLKLLNVIKRGELLELHWKSIQEQTQSFVGNVNYPFLFQSPFGIDAQFKLYKRDTSYLEIKSRLGVQYFLRGGNYFKVFYEKYTSSVLSGGLNNPSFQNLGSVDANSYGVAMLRQQVDYVPNPSRGFIFSSEIAFGLRKSKTSDTSTVLTSTTYKGKLNLSYFFPLAKRHVILLANETEFYYAPTIFQNEVTRFGGLSNQRGFNEEELFSTTKSTLTVEYRFLVDQNSRAFLFYDQSWYENNATLNYFNDQPKGFGAGFSFGTNIGIFSISYALGKQLNNPILVKDGKVHFGYIAYF